MQKKQNVLFLCTGNSCRSQMAEGLLRHFAGEGIEALSAGMEPGKRYMVTSVRQVPAVPC
ncbi:MAG: hypothetical protein FDX02_06660 [Chlorobium sp.]|nr:MAG: hypothetical protein FDX02_06660 [Chlorobium sp.]